MTKTSLLHRNERYTQRINALLAEMSHFSEEILNRKPSPDGWSAIQTIHHLILTEELSLGYVRKKLGFNPVLETAGPSMRWRGFLLWTYLNTPFKFKAPKHVSDEHLPDHATLADTRARWQKSRTEWTDFLTQMPDEMANKAVYKHPFSGRLGWPQTMAFFEIHFARHSKQVRKAIANAQKQ